jgi:hypothetical protein
MYKLLLRSIVASCLIAVTMDSSASYRSFIQTVGPTVPAIGSIVPSYNPGDSDLYFKLRMNKGDKIGNVFSRACSFKGDSIAEAVWRVSGTAVYTVLDNDPEKPAFSCTARYDGRPEASGKVTITNNGRTNVHENGQSDENTDASGILYNSLIWGAPPATLKPGVTWNVTMTGPWELGCPGVQKVTVIATDPKNHTITLQREGEGAGFYDGDQKQVKVVKDGKTIMMDMTPGNSHWTGYTIIKDGLIISDELVVTRPVTLTTGDQKFAADQRQYILLNLMPATN